MNEVYYYYWWKEIKLVSRVSLLSCPSLQGRGRRDTLGTRLEGSEILL